LLGGTPHEHERAAGALQAEWQTVPDLFRFAAGAIHWIGAALKDLMVHPERMGDNLTAAGGLAMAEALTVALAKTLGRADAYRIVDEVAAQAARAGISLHEAAAADERVRSVLAGGRLDRVLDPREYRGSTDAFIEYALNEYRKIRGSLEAAAR
jgi:3-carboxy-cis,cis-muconate cycloisomerase